MNYLTKRIVWIVAAVLFISVLAVAGVSSYKTIVKYVTTDKTESNTADNHSIAGITFDNNDILYMTVNGKRYPVSPVIISKIEHNKYNVMIDELIGTTESIRQELISLKTDDSIVKSFKLNFPDKTEMSFNEMPNIVQARIAYNKQNIIPLRESITWMQKNQKKLSEWKTIFDKAGFKEDSDRDLQDTGGKDKEAVLSLSKNRNIYANILYVKPSDNINKKINKQDCKVKTVVIYYVSKNERITAGYLTKIEQSRIKAIQKNGRIERGGLIWRDVYALPDYIVLNHEKRGGINFYTLGDIEPSISNGTMNDVTIYGSYLETWHEIPISRAWVLDKKEWDNIKESFMQTVLGRKVTDSDLSSGYRTPDDLYIKVESVGNYDIEGKIKLVHISIVDKITDLQISSLFNFMNKSDIDNIRNNALNHQTHK